MHIFLLHVYITIYNMSRVLKNEEPTIIKGSQFLQEKRYHD